MGESRSRSRSASGSRGRRSHSRSRSRGDGGAAAAGASGDKVTGVALRWQGQRGFGFIKPDDGSVPRPRLFSSTTPWRNG